MDKQYFLELLHRYLNDEVTSEEEQFLLKYYDLFSAEPDVIEILNDDQRTKLKTDIQASIWKNIEEHDQTDKKTIPLRTWLLKIAAAAIIIGVCGMAVLFSRNEPGIKPSPLSSVHKQKANLFLVLPDGSRVILSYGSKLRHASSFANMAKREVYLEGEAFFDIKHNDLKPFVVHTGKVETTVLGTAFDVKALPGDKTITVTVTRGRVKVSDQDKILGIITPNQQITYSKQKLNSTQTRINAAQCTGWIAEDDLYFEDVTVAEAAKLLEGRFKVKISFSDELVKSKYFTSTFDKSESLEQELRSICEFNDAFYTYDKEKANIIISSKHKTN